MKNLLSFIILIIFFSSTIKSQTCGFGCLGISGAFIGYSYQNINLIEYNIFKNYEKKNFKDFKGVRFGSNLFRANFNGYFLSFKGYYQNLTEEIKFSGISSVPEYFTVENTLSISGFGVGLDFGIPISNYLDLKIVDLGLNFYNATLTEKYTTSLLSTENKFSNTGTDIGYYFGTGLILNVVKNYVSVEGSVYYSYLRITKMVTDDGVKLWEKDDFINSGNFGYTVQFNLGIPF